MRIYCEENYDALSARAADIIAAELIRKPNCVLGLATGSTPIGVYLDLAEKNARGEIDFSEAKSINLDEYIGLDPSNDQSYRYFMQKNLFDHVNIDQKTTFLPNGMAEDMQAECDRYDKLMELLGYADIQVLGIGQNGHIGFNEPGDAFIAPTHTVRLTENTIAANARFFADESMVPREAITMGIRGIMRAKRVILVASGENKAEAIERTIHGPITPACPASILQLHPDCVIVADKAAMGR